VERHDSLLPDSLLGVQEQLDDLGQHGGHGLLADEPTGCGESGAYDEVVVGPEVLLDGVDDEDDEVVALVDEERDGEVPRALERERLVVGHLDGVDVTEGGVVAEHLGVDEAEEELLHLAAGHVRVGEAALEVLQLARDDAVLLRLGARLADGLDEVEELLGLPPPALGAHRQLPPDRPQLLHCGARSGWQRPPRGRAWGLIAAGDRGGGVRVGGARGQRGGDLDRASGGVQTFREVRWAWEIGDERALLLLSVFPLG
jgi:hypothetical protein